MGMTRLADTRAFGKFENLPLEMRLLAQWCVTPGTADDKAPRDPKRGRRDFASTTDPSTWSDFETACRVALERGWLIGFVFTASDTFACIDLDVKPDTSPEQIALYERIVANFDSYTEVSRSGLGLHILLVANIGPGCKRDGVEVYSQERFLICTGDQWGNRQIADRQDMLANMVSQMRPDDYSPVLLKDEPERDEDSVIIERALRAANGEKFRSLANGVWQGRYKSVSEADMALLGIIAFYTSSNEQARRIFRKTELGKREKVTKNDRYLDMTLVPIRSRQAAEAERARQARQLFKNIGDQGAEGGALPPTMNLAEMHDGLVDIAAEKPVVVFRDNPAVQLSPAVMASLLRHNTFVVLTQTGEKEVSSFASWRSSDRRKVAYTLTFDPSEGRFCRAEDGRLAMNLWNPRPHTAPPDWQTRSRLFEEHVAYLIPDLAERERFLDWLAHIEQQPGVLSHNHYLMIAIEQGVGRNWLASLLACIWAGHVALDYDLKASLANGFNGQLSRKLLAVVDEINEGGTGERWQHSEKLKSMVTTSHRFINMKYGLQHTERNCCRWLVFSNHESALPLTEDDRRWNIIRNPSEPRSEAYYRQLYATLYPKPDPLFVSSVKELLRRRDIAAFNPGARAAMNTAKEALMASNKSHEDELADDLVATYLRDLILADHLFEAIFEVDPSMSPDASRRWKLIAPIARKAGAEPMPRPLPLFGRPRMKVWILRNAERWRAADLLAIQEELSRVS